MASAALRLVILGTPLGTWLPLGEAVETALSGPVHAGTLSVRVDHDAGCRLAALASEDTAETRCLIFVDGPGPAVAQWLAAGAVGGDDGIKQTLATWRDGAKRLLQHAHRWPGNCLFVDTAEAAAAPNALISALSRWIQVLSDIRSLDVARVETDPLCAILGHHLAASDSESAALFAELQLTCAVLDTHETGATEGFCTGTALTRRALDRFAQLAASEVERKELAGKASFLRRQLDEGAERQRAQRAEVGRLSRESLELQATIAELRQDNEQALGQLHLMQGEIELVLQQKTAADSDLEDALLNRDRIAEELKHSNAGLMEAAAQLDAARADREALAYGLAQERQAAEATRSAGSALESELHQARHAAQQLQARAQQLQASLNDGMTQLAAACAERDALAHNLAQERQTVEAARSAGSALESELHQARHAAQQLQARTEQLQASVNDGMAQLASVRRERDALAREVDLKAQAASSVREAAARLEAAVRAELDESRREGQSLFRELHQMQDELQEQFLGLEELKEAARSVHGHAGGVAACVGSLALTEVRDVLPHRQLHFELHEFVAAGRTVPRLEVRLVEHEGRPGLVLFSTLTGAEAVSAWESSGEENGRAFMLVVPTDSHGEHLLEHLGGTDWWLLLGLAAVLQQEVKANAARLAAHWLVIATRLVRQLESAPPRLRYDSLTVSACAPETGNAWSLDVVFDNASCGMRVLGRLHLRWTPDASPRRRPGSSALRWMTPQEPEALPFASWPITMAGLLQESLELPVGRGLNAREKRRQWVALAPDERGMLLAVIDELRAAAAHAPEVALQGGLSRTILSDEAAAICGDARQTIAGMQMRAAVRRIVRVPLGGDERA